MYTTGCTSPVSVVSDGHSPTGPLLTTRLQLYKYFRNTVKAHSSDNRQSICDFLLLPCNNCVCSAVLHCLRDIATCVCIISVPLLARCSTRYPAGSIVCLADREKRHTVQFSCAYIGLPYVRVSPDTSSFRPLSGRPGGFSKNQAFVRVLHIGTRRRQHVSKV